MSIHVVTFFSSTLTIDVSSIGLSEGSMLMLLYKPVKSSEDFHELQSDMDKTRQMLEASWGEPERVARP